MQIDPLVFYRLPQTLNEHIIPPGSASVHADLATPILDGLHELMRGELAALVGIHNLGRSMVIERLLQYIDRMAGLQRDRHLCGQHPNLVGPLDGESPQ